MFLDDLRVDSLCQRIRQIVFRRHLFDDYLSTRYFLLHPQLLLIPMAALASDLIAIGLSNFVPKSAAKDLIPRATLAAFTIA